MVWLVLLCTLMLPVLTPDAAVAYTFSNPPIAGPPDPVTGVIPICPGSGLTRRVIPCIKENILEATNTFLTPFSVYIADAVAAACTLAVALWGTLLVTGKAQAPTSGFFVLAIKIGAVVLFTSNFGGLFPALLDSLDYMLGVVGNYVINISGLMTNPLCVVPAGDPVEMMVWNGMDCLIETLVGGIFSPFSLALGLTGFIFACLFSGSIGFFIAMLGFYMVSQFLFIVARALYIFLSAYIAFAIMVIISPLIIPTILFTATKGYFDKWVRLTSSFIIQPIILFAYLSMLAATYNAVVFTAPYSLAYSLAGSDAGNPGFNIGGWLINKGIYGEKSHMGKAVEIDPKEIIKNLGKAEDLDSGVLATIGERVGASEAQWKSGIFDFLGVGNSGLADLRHFKIDVPTTAVDWLTLTVINNVVFPPAHPDAGQPDVITYITQLLLSLAMCCIMVFIMNTLLSFLPFISASILGQPLAMNPMGVGKMAPPGSKAMNNLGNTMGKGLSGGVSPSSGIKGPGGGGMGGPAGGSRGGAPTPANTVSVGMGGRSGGSR